jgi:hypothetical protein
MGKPTSKKPAKVTSPKFWWADDIINEMTKPLPLGIPLDEGIFDGILQHWLLLEQFHEQVQEGTATPQVIHDVTEHFAKHFQLIYMEVLWRQIKRKQT